MLSLQSSSKYYAYPRAVVAERSSLPAEVDSCIFIANIFCVKISACPFPHPCPWHHDQVTVQGFRDLPEAAC
eukprot:5533871-Pyramimonas_sp.AAC.1